MTKQKVWLVDDEVELLETCEAMISKSYSVSTFLSGEEMFSALAKGEVPDLVVTDIKMPGMNGLQLVETLRASKLEIPVIVVSGHADKDHAMRALGLGVFALMEKPFHPSEYRHTIQKALTHGALFKLSEDLLVKYSALIESMEALIEKARSRYILAENQLPAVPVSGADKQKILHYMQDVVAESKIEDVIVKARDEIRKALAQREILKAENA